MSKITAKTSIFQIVGYDGRGNGGKPPEDPKKNDLEKTHVVATKKKTKSKFKFPKGPFSGRRVDAITLLPFEKESKYIALESHSSSIEEESLSVEIADHPSNEKKENRSIIALVSPRGKKKGEKIKPQGEFSKTEEKQQELAPRRNSIEAEILIGAGPVPVSLTISNAPQHLENPLSCLIGKKKLDDKDRDILKNLGPEAAQTHFADLLLEVYKTGTFKKLKNLCKVFTQSVREEYLALVLFDQKFFPLCCKFLERFKAVNGNTKNEPDFMTFLHKTSTCNFFEETQFPFFAPLLKSVLDHHFLTVILPQFKNPNNYDKRITILRSFEFLKNVSSHVVREHFDKALRQGDYETAAFYIKQGIIKLDNVRDQIDLIVKNAETLDGLEPILEFTKVDRKKKN